MKCKYCEGSEIAGVHLPSDFDDREPSRDGKVFVARCDECSSYASDIEAAEVVAAKMGWRVHKSMDAQDALDIGSRLQATGEAWYRPYFEITVVDANKAHESDLRSVLGV